MAAGGQVTYNAPIYWESSNGHPNFLDYKYGTHGIASTFDATNRGDIWHYLLFGYNFQESPSTSGVSTAGGPDAFVSYGLIKDNPNGWPGGTYPSLNSAIGGQCFTNLATRFV